MSLEIQIPEILESLTFTSSLFFDSSTIKNGLLIRFFNQKKHNIREEPWCSGHHS